VFGRHGENFARPIPAKPITSNANPRFGSSALHFRAQKSVRHAMLRRSDHSEPQDVCKFSAGRAAFRARRLQRRGDCNGTPIARQTLELPLQDVLSQSLHDRKFR
jgi:hypothetical protein